MSVQTSQRSEVTGPKDEVLFQRTFLVGVQDVVVSVTQSEAVCDRRCLGALAVQGPLLAAVRQRLDELTLRVGRAAEHDHVLLR